MREQRVVDPGEAREVRAVEPRPRLGKVAAVRERAELARDRLEPPALALGVDDEQRVGRLAHDDLLPRDVALELDDARVAGAADRRLDDPDGALLRGRRRDLARDDRAGERECLVEARPLLGGRELLVPAPVQAGDHPADRHRRPDAVEDRRDDRLAGVVGVDALHERLVDALGDVGVAVAQGGAVLAPHEPERGVAHPVGALARAALLVVVEVAGRRIAREADVDAHVGGGRGCRRRGCGRSRSARRAATARRARRPRRRGRNRCGSRPSWRSMVGLAS